MQILVLLCEHMLYSLHQAFVFDYLLRRRCQAVKITKQLLLLQLFSERHARLVRTI